MQHNHSILILSDADEDLYEYVKNIILKKKRNMINIRPSKFVFNLLTKKQKRIFVYLHLKEYQECPICYDIINYTNKIKTSCNHIFCKNCIHTIFSVPPPPGQYNPCPCCRRDLVYYSFLEPSLIKITTVSSLNLFNKKHSLNYCHPFSKYKNNKWFGRFSQMKQFLP